MKNPWKRLSNINPQREDGTRQINSEVLSALIRAKLPTAEMSVVLVVISKTWGFNKQSDAISTSQFVEETGFSSRSIKTARANLMQKRIIYFDASKRVKRGSPLNEYMFNKHHDTWILEAQKKGEVDFTGEVQGKKRVKQTTPTIETITKEKENIYTSNFLKFWEAYPRKVGKGAAFKAYKNIKQPKPSLKTVIESIKQHNETDQWQTTQFIPHPATWLNQRRWEDEIDTQNSKIVKFDDCRPKTKEEIQAQLAEARK